MSFWRQLTHGLRVLTNRTAAEGDLAEEVQDYLDQTTAACEAKGLRAEEARRAARREIGNAMLVSEQVRASGWENVVETLLADLRYAARQLRNNPGFAATAILVLGLGIGATTAIFSAVNPILFNSLPYPHPDQIMAVFEMKDGGSRLPSFATFEGISERSQSFNAMAAMKVWRPAMVGVGEPEFFWGQRVSVGYFRSLGVVPALGRDLQAADDQIHGPNVLILSDRLWRRRFGAD